MREKFMGDLHKVPSASDTARFYDDLMEGKEKRGILGKDRRYNSLRIMQRPSTKKYFIDVVKPYFKGTEKVLDFGCGPGSFLAVLAPYCREITGVDIAKNFVFCCQQTIEHLGVTNAQTQHIQPGRLPFEDQSFDVIMLVDVLHHLDNISYVMAELTRVLVQNGRFIILEPNKLNPAMFLFHLFDRHEWGLLRLGTPRIYQKILSPYLHIEKIEFNGIVIGPESKLWDAMSDMMNDKILKHFIGWLNPKMFITGIKR